MAEWTGPDWRDWAAYAPLLDADRSMIAWEWLRRDPRYRTAAQECGSSGNSGNRLAEQFGLVAFERPGAALPDARPMWSRDVHPFVLIAVTGGRQDAADMLDIGALRHLASLKAGKRFDHLLLSDGVRSIRLDAPRGALAKGPVALRFILSGLASAEPQLLTLRRLLSLCRSGRFASSLHRPEPRARRWALLLRTCDALEAGANQRLIARELLSRSVAEPRWRSRESSVRSQVQRLATAARSMARGGYLRLLGPASLPAP